MDFHQQVSSLSSTSSIWSWEISAYIWSSSRESTYNRLDACPHWGHSIYCSAFPASKEDLPLQTQPSASQPYGQNGFLGILYESLRLQEETIPSC